MRQLNFILLLTIVLLSACTMGIVQYSACEPIDLHAKIAVIPFANYTETPLAGERAMSITAAILKSRGFCNVVVYQPSEQGKRYLPGMELGTSEKKLLPWARQQGARYAMTGSVNEWGYKVGLDGEPVVGISVQLLELSSGRIVWTAVGSKSRGSRVAASTVAQDLLSSLLKGLSFRGKTCHIR